MLRLLLSCTGLGVSLTWSLGGCAFGTRCMRHTWPESDLVPDRSELWLAGLVYFEPEGHGEVVFRQHRLHILRQVLQELLANAVHFRLERDLGILILELLVQFLFVQLGLLGFCFLFIDFHSAVVVVKLDVLLDGELKVAQHGLDIWAQR